MTPPPTNRGRRFPPEPLTPEEVTALLAAIPSRSVSGVRMRAVVALLYGTGLRLQEALDLMPRDLDLTACSVRVRHGKGDRARVTGIDPASAAHVARWLDRRAALRIGARVPVFCTYADGVSGPLDPRYVRAALQRFGARAGITKRVHPHGLRHSHAFSLANEGVPVHVISRALGHSNVGTTNTYIAHVNPRAVIDTMRTRDPYARS